MASKSTVGKSERTPAKHAAMDKQLGREMGADSRYGWVPYLIDLCAGDGTVTAGAEWKRHCSPGLVAWHLGYKPTGALHWSAAPQGVLIEKQQNTYVDLKKSLEQELPKLAYPGRGKPWRQVGDGKWFCWDTGAELSVVHGSGADADISQLKPWHAVYVLQDPNTILHWPMRKGFIAEIGQRTQRCLSMSTLGCNVGGSKRASRAEREGWYKNIRDIQQALHPWHDLYIARIDPDDAQWAYLFEVPDPWRDKVEEDVFKAFGSALLTVDGAWQKTQPEKFNGILDTLFLTRSELKEMSAS